MKKVVITCDLCGEKMGGPGSAYVIRGDGGKRMLLQVSFEHVSGTYSQGDGDICQWCLREAVAERNP